jgi:hypothetical protein
LLRDDVIEAAEARTIVDDMIDEGWYCAPDLYAGIVGTIEELG